MTDDMKNEIRNNVRDSIFGVSEQFIDDFMFIIERKFENMATPYFLFGVVSSNFFPIQFVNKKQIHLKV